MSDNNEKDVKQAKTKKQKTKKQKTLFRTIIKVNLILIALIGVAVIIFFYNKYGKDIFAMRKDAKNIVKNSSLDTFRSTETSLVYDKNGELISVLKGAKDVYYLTFEEIPTLAVDAIISIEDKSYYKHFGVDLKGIARAFKAYVDNKGEVTQGASTITQQLSRNMFLSFEVTWERKIREIWIAMEMEKKYSKTQIMEFYMNNIYFANGYYGIQAASRGYFNKDVSELSLSQLVFLCAIPNNPTLYDPVDNLKNTIKRRDRILEQMLNDKKIESKDYVLATHETITLNMPKLDKQNFVETYIYYCASRELMKEQGFIFQYDFNNEEEKAIYDEKYSQLYKQCQQSLFTSGYRIYTSIDLEKQAILQEAIDETLKGFNEMNEEGIYMLQGAATCIDNETGRVVAIVGGRYQETNGYTLNRAYQSFRQPGSAIKPLVVYAPIFDRGYSPEKIVVDEKIDKGPANSDGKFLGSMTIRRAVELSRNTIAWKLFEELGISTAISYLKEMQFSKIVKEDYVPAASIGGLTYGASPVEMAAAYAAIENDGIFRAPTCIVKITDTQGKEIVKDRILTKSIYKENASRLMTNILEGVITAGTARGKGVEMKGIATAGKTGTTNDKKDGWFVGYTPYYTTSVWVGYDIPKTLNTLAGSTYPVQIWRDFMHSIHEGFEEKSFLPYEDDFINESTTQPPTTEEPTTEEETEPITEEEPEIIIEITTDNVITTDDSFINIDELEDADFDFIENWTDEELEDIDDEEDTKDYNEEIEAQPKTNEMTTNETTTNETTINETTINETTQEVIEEAEEIE